MIAQELVTKLNEYMTLHEIAAELRVSYFAVRAWKYGERNPGYCVREMLSKLLREKSEPPPKPVIGKYLTCRRAFYAHITPMLSPKNFTPNNKEFFETTKGGMKLFSDRYPKQFAEFQRKFKAEAAARRKSK